MSNLFPPKPKNKPLLPLFNILSPKIKEVKSTNDLVKGASEVPSTYPRVPGYVIKKGYILKKKIGKEMNRSPVWTCAWKRVFVVLKSYTLEYYWNEHRCILRIPPQKRWKIDSSWRLRKGDSDSKEDCEVSDIGYILRITVPCSALESESPRLTTQSASEGPWTDIRFAFPTIESRDEWFRCLSDAIAASKWVEVSKPSSSLSSLGFSSRSKLSSASSQAINRMKDFTPDLLDSLQISGISLNDVEQDPEGILAILDFATKEPILQPPPQVKTTAEMQQALDQNVRMEDPTALFTARTKIGEGGFSTVYACRRISDNRPVAVKVIQRTEKTNMQRLLNEIAMMFLLRGHPNMIDTYGAYVTNDEVWVVMECMFGGCLTDVILNGERLEEDEIAYVAREVLQGLSSMHKEFRIHRDIKSDNILLGLDGEIKLSDFGFSAQLTTEEDSRSSKVGTGAWMAPEVILQSQYSQTADIWSFGMLCLEMAEKEPPYLKLSQIQRYQKIVHGPPPTLAHPEKWSPEFFNFISKMLIKMPQERYTADKLLRHPFIRRACPPEKFSKKVQFIRSHVLKSSVDKLTLNFPKPNSQSSGHSNTNNNSSHGHSNTVTINVSNIHQNANVNSLHYNSSNPSWLMNQTTTNSGSSASSSSNIIHKNYYNNDNNNSEVSSNFGNFVGASNFSNNDGNVIINNNIYLNGDVLSSMSVNSPVLDQNFTSNHSSFNMMMNNDQQHQQQQHHHQEENNVSSYIPTST